MILRNRTVAGRFDGLSRELGDIDPVEWAWLTLPGGGLRRAARGRAREQARAYRTCVRSRPGGRVARRRRGGRPENRRGRRLREGRYAQTERLSRARRVRALAARPGPRPCARPRGEAGAPAPRRAQAGRETRVRRLDRSGRPHSRRRGAVAAPSLRRRGPQHPGRRTAVVLDAGLSGQGGRRAFRDPAPLRRKSGPERIPLAGGREFRGLHAVVEERRTRGDRSPQDDRASRRRRVREPAGTRRRYARGAGHPDPGFADQARGGVGARPSANRTGRPRDPGEGRPRPGNAWSARCPRSPGRSGCRD